jgi:hypothetical protein
MPVPDLGPFESPTASAHVVAAPPPTRRFQMDVEHEALDYECTAIVQ